MARLRLVSTALLAASALMTANAAAADRHVAPTGGGTACTEVAPCSLPTGVNGATSGDVVHVDGDHGPYPVVEEWLSVANGVEVVGEGGTLPQISFGSSGHISLSGRATALDLKRTAGVGILITMTPDAAASRLKLESSTYLTAEMFGGVLSDSVVRYTGTVASPALQITGTTVLRNVTVEATGPESYGIRVYSTEAPPPVSICTSANPTLRNVIARGPKYDLNVAGSSSNCKATVDVAFSNYRAGAVKVENGALVDSGGNQTSVDPLLAADGFHQLAGSPTIDAGTTSTGAVDIDGEARLAGAAPDIGADEFQPAPPSDSTAPVGSGLRLKPRRFLPAAKRKPSVAALLAQLRKRIPSSTRVEYTLSEDAGVRFRVKRALAGRRRGKRCVVGKAARGVTGKRCRKLVAVRGSFTHAGRQGANGFRFSGFVGGKRLRAGSYRLSGVPTDAAGNRGAEFRASFSIARG